MRIVNKFFSGLLMIMTASVCSNLSANQNAAIEENQLPVYSNNLAGISLDFEDRLLTGLIETDSGLVFRIVDYKNRDDNVLKTWQAGDVLSIKSSIDHDVLVFDIKRTNVEDSDEVEVVAVLDVTKESPAALHITKIIEDGEVIQLSDGSAWTFGWLQQNTTKKWSVGERLIVQNDGTANAYYFINVDAPVGHNAHSTKGSYLLAVE